MKFRGFCDDFDRSPILIVTRGKIADIFERSCASAINGKGRAFIVNGYLLGIPNATHEIPLCHVDGSM